MTLFVRYAGPASHYTRYSKLDFTVALVDPCLYDKLNIDSSIMEST